MATKKVLFFIAGATATAPELALIAGLNARAIPELEVLVRRADIYNGTEGGSLESHDFVAGTIPEDYEESDEVPASGDIVNAGDTTSVKNSAASKTVAGASLEFAAGVLDHVKLPATAALHTNGQALVVPVTGVYATTATLTIAAGVVTGIVLS